MTYPPSGGQIWPNGAGVTQTTVYLNGVLVATRGIINLIEGTNVTLTITDDPGNNAVDIEIAAAGGGGGDGMVGVSFDAGGSLLDLLGTTKFKAIAKGAGDLYAVQVETDGASGSCTLGVKRGAGGGGALADVTGGADVVLTATDSYFDAVLAGWSPTHIAGDVYEFELKSVSGFRSILATLYYA